jgi:hypothetical protein
VVVQMLPGQEPRSESAADSRVKAAKKRKGPLPTG